MGSGRGWLASDWPLMGDVLNITAAAWTARFHWWHSGNITQTQNVSEYMLVLTLCLAVSAFLVPLPVIGVQSIVTSVSEYVCMPVCPLAHLKLHTSKGLGM